MEINQVSILKSKGKVVFPGQIFTLNLVKCHVFTLVIDEKTYYLKCEFLDEECSVFLEVAILQFLEDVGFPTTVVVDTGTMKTHDDRIENFFLLEAIPHRNLEEEIHAENISPISFRNILNDVMIQANQLLDLGIIHYDINIRNILVNGNRGILIDFGIVNIIEGSRCWNEIVVKKKYGITPKFYDSPVRLNYIFCIIEMQLKEHSLQRIVPRFYESITGPSSKKDLKEDLKENFVSLLRDLENDSIEDLTVTSS